MMAFIEENNLKKTALNYAFDYSEKIAEAKKAMDAVIASKKPINNATLQNTFNDAVNKKIIEDYFSTGDPKAYKTKLSGTEYTVTQKPTTPP